jgi:type IV secretory pathway component VirB8
MQKKKKKEKRKKEKIKFTSYVMNIKKVYLATLSKTNKQVTLAHTIGIIMYVTYRVAISVVGAVPLPVSLRSPSM